MNSIGSLFFFLLVFTSLIFLKSLTKFLGALLQKEPRVLLFSNRELILLGASISYILTYICQK